MKEKLTQEYLKECLTYDPDTGIFVWNQRPLSHFKTSRSWKMWNTRFSNKHAGIYRDDGYLLIHVFHRLRYAHRLAFLYMEGYIPENGVDHIDRNTSNNRWNNLREVSQMCNMQNCRVSKNNTSKVTGVGVHKASGKWRSRIMVYGEYLNLGLYERFEDAVMARYLEELRNPGYTCCNSSSAYKYLKENNLI